MNILFFYVHNWAKEIADFRRGHVPSHRLWGFAEVERFGHTATACPVPERLRRWLAKPVLWRLWQALYALWHQRDVDCVVAIYEASVLPALILRRFGILRTPIVVVGNALLHKRNHSRWRKTLWRWLLPAADAIGSFSSAQGEWIAEEFDLPPERMVFLPMFVDTEFFSPDSGGQSGAGDFCLSVGTNEGKDYPTLLDALPPGEKLLIVTDPLNAAVIRQHARPEAKVEVRQSVPIAELHTLYRAAKVMIIPLREMKAGSGHTVLLENMALGKPVIVSGVPGVFEYVEDGVTAIVFKPHDSADLARRLQEYLAAPERFAAIGQRAAARVRAEFGAENFGRKLLGVIERVTQGMSPSLAEARSSEEAPARPTVS